MVVPVFATSEYNSLKNMVPVPEFFWHATPLQFLPAILAAGELRASANPRPTALARRRKLGLERFVHLSFSSQTPLLANKLQRGYPHALLAFDPEIASQPGAAYLKWNTKRWAHRDEFIPITDPQEKSAFLDSWRCGKFPSAELLIPEQLSLTYATGLLVRSQAEWEFLASFGLNTPPMTLAPERFPVAPEADLSALWTWAAECQKNEALLPSLHLPFD